MTFKAPDRLGYQPALDGIRAVAVVAVLLFHGGVSWATGGFLGVDVFFVLSGFLITTLLLEESARTGHIGLRAFWARRARRLLPAMLAVTAVVLAMGSLLAPDRPLRELRIDAAATLGYVANWRFIAADANYFARAAGPSPLEHTWSLAVEEQFYLLWPLLAAAVLVRRRPALLGLLAGAGVIASAGAMAALYDSGAGASRAYFGTETRIHVVLVGALAAVVVDRLRTRQARAGTAGVPLIGPRACVVAALVAAAAIGFAIVRMSGDTAFLYRGGFLAVSIEAAVLIVAVTLAPRSIPARALALRPVAALGRISYGVYLWHWPAYLFLTGERTGLTGPSLLAVRIATTIALSIVSAVLIESPVRRERVLRTRLAVLTLPAAACVVIVALLIANMQLPAPQAPQALASELASATAGSPSLGELLEQPTPTTMAPPAPGEQLDVVLVGDSVATTLAQGLVRPAREQGIDLKVEAVLGCGIVRGSPYRYFGNVEEQFAECADWPQRWATMVQLVRPHVVVLLVGRWEVMDRAYDGVFTQLGDPVFDEYLLRELTLAVDVLRSSGARLALATAPYYKRGERPDGGIWPEDEPARVDAFNALLRRVATVSDAPLIDLNARTSDGNGGYTESLDGQRLRYDGVHFTPDGAASLGPWLFPQLDAIGRSP